MEAMAFGYLSTLLPAVIPLPAALNCLFPCLELIEANPLQLVASLRGIVGFSSTCAMAALEDLRDTNLSDWNAGLFEGQAGLRIRQIFTLLPDSKRVSYL